MYFALNKATDFFKQPWHTYLDYTCVAGTLCANPIYGLTTEEKRKKGKKNFRVTFVFSLVYLVWGSLVYNIYHHVFQIIC